MRDIPRRARHMPRGWCSMSGHSRRAPARPFNLHPPTMLTGLTSPFDGFMLMPAALQYAFVVAFGLVIGSFITVVVHRVPRMLERNWDASVAEYLEERASEADAAGVGA